METQLYGVDPVDPVTLAAAAAVFLTVAMFASVLPARRAAAVAQAFALRRIPSPFLHPAW